MQTHPLTYTHTLTLTHTHIFTHKCISTRLEVSSSHPKEYIPTYSHTNTLTHTLTHSHTLQHTSTHPSTECQAIILIGRHHIFFDNRLCKLCGQKENIVAVECDYHFLLECSLYEPLRDQYLPNNRTGHRTLFDIITTMTSSDTQEVVLLCKFIHYANKCRNVNL